MQKADEHAIAQGCHLDIEAAERVRTFMRKFLRHSKGQWAGKPFELLDWQWEQVIKPLFGWKRADGTRRFRRGYIEVPKKNGKSALCSGISLYLLIGDGEAGAEVYNAAADINQASIVFTEAGNMVEASPALSSRCEVLRSTKRINYPSQRSWYKALSADVKTKEGLNIHGLIFDELHAQPNRDLWDTLIYGGAARRQPMFLSITTAGYDKESICYEQHGYARGVLDGSIQDPSFFAYLSAAEEADDWKSPETWKKANPSLGVTIDISDMEQACKEAQLSPAKENAFRRYRLNQWTEQDVRAIPMDQWKACGRKYDWKDFEGRYCWAGLDLASTNDVTAMVLVFALDGGRFACLPRFWVPEEAGKNREARNRQRFEAWIRSGLMQVTPGSSCDYDFVRRDIVDLSYKYKFDQIAFDPWNARQLATQLEKDDGLPMIEFRQGFATMNAPTKYFLGLVADQKLEHPNDPVLNWMAGNFSVDTDPAGNLKPSKKSSAEKIDGIVALIEGVGCAMCSANTNSVYNEKGSLAL